LPGELALGQLSPVQGRARGERQPPTYRRNRHASTRTMNEDHPSEPPSGPPPSPTSASHPLPPLACVHADHGSRTSAQTPHWTSADKANCVASPSRQSPSPHEKAPLYPVDSSASSVPVALLLSMSVDHLVTAAAVVSALRSVRTTVQFRVVSRVAEPPLFWITKREWSDRMAPSFAAPVGSFSPSPLPPPPGVGTHDDVP